MQGTAYVWAPGMRVVTRGRVWDVSEREVRKGASGCLWEVSACENVAVVCLDTEKGEERLALVGLNELSNEGLLKNGTPVVARRALTGRGACNEEGQVLSYNAAANTYTVRFPALGLMGDVATREVQPVAKKGLLPHFLRGLLWKKKTKAPRRVPSSQQRKTSGASKPVPLLPMEATEEILHVGYYRPKVSDRHRSATAEHAAERQWSLSDDDSRLNTTSGGCGDAAFPLRNLEKIPQYSSLSGSPRARRGPEASAVSPLTNTSVSFPDSPPETALGKRCGLTTFDVAAPMVHETQGRGSPRPQVPLEASYTPVQQLESVHLSSMNSHASSASSASRVCGTSSSTEGSHHVSPSRRKPPLPRPPGRSHHRSRTGGSTVANSVVSFV